MGIIITVSIMAAAGGFVLLALLEGRGHLCDSCRYNYRPRERKLKWGICKILGYPACYDECKYYEFRGGRE